MALEKTPAQLQADSTAFVKQLTLTKNPADSLRILLNLYDLASMKQDVAYMEQVYSLAKRLKNTDVQGEMLQRLAVRHLENDSALNIIEAEAAKLPEGPVKKATQLFTYLEHTMTVVGYMSEKERKDHLVKLLYNHHHEQEQSDDIFKDVKDLYTLCLYLGYEAKGNLYYDHMVRLGALIDQLPQEASGIKTQYLVNQAIIYASHGEQQKSIDADMKILDIISNLEKKYEAQGRLYRNYDVSRYAVYRRLLSNYKSLTPQQIEDIHAKLMVIIARNADCRSDYNTNKRTEAYYKMAHKDYAGAIPLLRSQLDRAKNYGPTTFSCLEMLKEAAEATGDKETLLFALRETNNELEEYVKLQNSYAYRELEIKYETDKLKEDKANLEIANREEKVRMSQRIICICLLAAFALIIIVLILHRNYSKTKIRLADVLRENEMQKRRIEDAERINNELITKNRERY